MEWEWNGADKVKVIPAVGTLDECLEMETIYGAMLFGHPPFCVWKKLAIFGKLDAMGAGHGVTGSNLLSPIIGIDCVDVVGYFS